MSSAVLGMGLGLGMVMGPGLAACSTSDSVRHTIDLLAFWAFSSYCLSIHTYRINSANGTEDAPETGWASEYGFVGLALEH